MNLKNEEKKHSSNNNNHQQLSYSLNKNLLSSSGTLGDDKRQITAGNPNEIWTFSRLKNNEKKFIDNNIDSTFFKHFSYKNFFDKSRVLKVKHEKFESYRDKEEISLHRLRNAINKIFNEQDKKYIKRKNILKENCNILYDKNIKKVSNKNYNKDLANCKSYDNFKFSNKNFRNLDESFEIRAFFTHLIF